MNRSSRFNLLLKRYYSESSPFEVEGDVRILPLFARDNGTLPSVENEGRCTSNSLGSSKLFLNDFEWGPGVSLRIWPLLPVSLHALVPPCKSVLFIVHLISDSRRESVSHVCGSFLLAP